MPFAHTEMVNLDYAASTPLRLSAIDAQREYDNGSLAGVNPNSLHSLGRAGHKSSRDAAARSLKRLDDLFAQAKSSLLAEAPKPTQWPFLV